MDRTYVTTGNEARAEIAAAIEAGGTDVASRDYDIDAILDETYAYELGRGFYQAVDHDGFWSAVERHAR